MKRKRELYPFRIFSTLCGIGVCLAGLLIYPETTAQGIKNGLVLLGEKIIPSLFPFMVLSTYISQSPATDLLGRVLDRSSRLLWNVSGNGILAVILGYIGGYPVGAKTVSEFYDSGKLTQSEATRLMNWCINPGPAFVITAIGTFMLNDTVSGIILYASGILSSLTIGAFFRFFGNTTNPPRAQQKQRKPQSLLVRSVSTGSEAMLSMCGWVLTFSAISALCDKIIKYRGLSLFLQAISEVTNGCSICANIPLSLPTLSAILGFGGFAVIAQVSPYLEKCGVKIKTFVCWRTVNASLNTFFCSGILKVLSREATVHISTTNSNGITAVSHGISAAAIMILMCLVLIFEVDNRRKV